MVNEICPFIVQIATSSFSAIIIKLNTKYGLKDIQDIQDIQHETHRIQTIGR